MFTIGAFARHGRVSERMLRHYDAIGLLRPAHVDPSSGYRLYAACQLARLNRIVALKELGFSLHQVATMLDESLTVEEFRGMLRLREAQLQSQISADQARLSQVEARLQIIEKEGAMAHHDIQVKHVPGVRVAELRATADRFEPSFVGPVIQPLYEELCRQLDTAGIEPTGPAIAYYEDAPHTDGGVVVHACLPVNAEPRDDDDGFAVVDLPAIEKAATIVHRGPMDGVMSSIQTLAHWIDASGYRSTGYNRELYLDYGRGEPSGWTTELQEPVVAAVPAGAEQSG
jgi:DNA-binding transcriptional MerR regulator